MDEFPKRVHMAFSSLLNHRTLTLHITMIKVLEAGLQLRYSNCLACIETRVQSAAIRDKAFADTGYTSVVFNFTYPRRRASTEESQTTGRLQDGDAVDSSSYS